MITLASLIERFEPALLARYRHALLPSQRMALGAMKLCRTRMAPRMLAQCPGCDEQRLVPHSCGHRSCPHCQHFQSQRWIEQQTQRLVAGNYFLVTFTLPATAKFLFDHKALAKVFRGKLLAALHQRGIARPAVMPKKWVVHCKCVGDGRKALVYLGRYLYRGVIREDDILRCEADQVTYRWRDSKSGKMVLRTVSGATLPE